MTARNQQKPRLVDWVTAARPRTLPAAVAPVAVGTAAAYAAGGFDLWPAATALAGALLLQIAVNLANDYFDFTRGVDTAERVGPVRVTQAGLIAPQTVRRALGMTLVLATLVGGLLILRGGWPVLLVGIASIGGVLAYSGGPRPLASLGLGDLAVFLFFGPVAVCGSAYVQALCITGATLLYSLPVGFLITAILVVNNLRDIDTDRSAGKHTLAVRIGVAATRREYLLLILLAYALLPMLAASGTASPWILLALVSAPLAAGAVKGVYTATGRQLNAVLAETAKVALIFSLLLAGGILAGTL